MLRATALVLGLLAGCASQPQTIEVRVPVPVPCQIPDIPWPALPIDSLPADADVFVASRALWASLELMEGWAATAEAAMSACR